MPENWHVTINGDEATVVCDDATRILLEDTQPYPVRAAGQIPSGFEPGDTYSSRNHPRGLQLATFAVSDALRSTGIPWDVIQQKVDPQKISVYASRAMGQLDEFGTGGMLRSNLQGKRVSSKQCPMGFADMTADFVNAYVLGNVGNTGAMAGACATFLYNLRMGIQDIQSGRAHIVLVGASEAPVIPEVMEGYRAMSMRRVAAACNMKLGNLTYHFPSREDLVRELFEAVIRSYEIEFDAITHAMDMPPEDRLTEICGLILEDIRTKKTTRFFPELWALSNHDEFVLDRVQELYKRARAPLFDIIGEMRPDLSEDDRQDLTLFISASMEGMTVFAGYEKPYESRMPAIEVIAIRSFINIARNYKR